MRRLATTDPERILVVCTNTYTGRLMHPNQCARVNKHEMYGGKLSLAFFEDAAPAEIWFAATSDYQRTKGTKTFEVMSSMTSQNRIHTSV